MAPFQSRCSGNGELVLKFVTACGVRRTAWFQVLAAALAVSFSGGNQAVIGKMQPQTATEKAAWMATPAGNGRGRSRRRRSREGWPVWVAFRDAIRKKQ